MQNEKKVTLFLRLCLSEVEIIHSRGDTDGELDKDQRRFRCARRLLQQQINLKSQVRPIEILYRLIPVELQAR